MIAVFWNAEDIVLLIVCVAAGILACIFFASILVADIKDAKRRREAKQAFERAQKHFKKTDDPDPEANPRQVPQ